MLLKNTRIKTLAVLTGSVASLMMPSSISFAQKRSTYKEAVESLPVSLQESLAKTTVTSQVKLGGVGRKVRFPHLKTAAEIEYYSFLRADKNFFGSDENSSTLTAVSLKASGQISKYNLNIQFLHAAEEQKNYFNIIELKKAYQFSRSEITVGRHLHNWSSADSFWDLGVWQPRFLWDRFEPVEQGMTGIFYQQKYSQLTYTLFGSFLYAPDQLPSYYIKDERVRSKNPWFRSLPPSANILDQFLVVNSGIERPDIEEVVFKPSFAIQAKYNASQNFNAQIAYTYKPMYQSLTTFDYYLQGQPSAPDIAVVTLYPKFPYHHVFSSEASFQGKKIKVTPSVIYQNPEIKSEPADYIAQNINSSTAVSLVASYQFDPSSEKFGRAYVGALKVWERWPRDRGNDASAKSQFDRRFPFYSAIKGGFEKSWVLNERPLFARVEGTYDVAINGGLLTTKVFYRIDKDKDLGFKLNLIGVTGNSDVEYDKTFVRSYRANDNVGVDFTYAF